MMRTTGRLLKFVAPFWRLVALSVLLGSATVGSSVALMGASAYLISMAALHPSIADLQVTIVAVRFFGISRGVFRYLERYVSHRVTFRLLARLRVWFYQSLEPLAPARLMEYRSGDLLNRVVADIETLEHFYIRVIAPLVVALLVVLGMGIFLSSYDITLFYVLLAFMFLAGVGISWLVRALSRLTGQRLIVSRAQLHARIVDSVQGLADLLAFNQGLHTLAQIQIDDMRYARLQKRMAWVSALQNGLSSLMTHLGMWAVLTLAVGLVAAGRLDSLYLAALVLAAQTSFEAILPLPQAAQNLDESLEAARRLYEIVDAQPEVQDAPDPLPLTQDFCLEGREICFRYASSEPLALDRLSFRIPKGGRLAIVGPSGSGKTTLVNLLLRFWDIQDGRILLGEHDLHRYRQENLRAAMAVVSQNTYLFTATVRENLLISRPDATQEELFDAARGAQVHAFIQSLPQGYETWIGEWGLRLSGGERQRFAIARTILKDAPLLILDEATANLDTLTEQDILGTLFALMEDRTTLMITHRLVGLENMDEIIVLDNGQMVEHGSHSELLAMSGLYRQMWDLQNQVLYAGK